MEKSINITASVEGMRWLKQTIRMELEEERETLKRRCYEGSRSKITACKEKIAYLENMLSQINDAM